MNCPICNKIIEKNCKHIAGKYRIYYTIMSNETTVWTGGTGENYRGSHVVFNCFGKFVWLDEKRIETMLLLK